MTKRAVDICFAPDELLWRAISTDDVVKKTGAVKPSCLRLQISVARSSKGRQCMDSALRPTAPPKYNGIAQVTVEEARTAKTEKVQAVCVDEPDGEYDEHALIALVTCEPPGRIAQEDINEARALLAGKMTVARKPV